MKKRANKKTAMTTTHTSNKPPLVDWAQHERFKLRLALLEPQTLNPKP